MDRRGFLRGILAAGVAPYVSTVAGVLMPVRKIYTGGLVGIIAEAPRLIAFTGIDRSDNRWWRNAPPMPDTILVGPEVYREFEKVWRECTR